VVEQRPFKPKVVGSIPTAPTNLFSQAGQRFGVIAVVSFLPKIPKGVHKTQRFFFDFFRALILAASDRCNVFIAAPFTASSILI
jgi:hypothetical protein